MRRLDLTLPTIAENVALDEALLASAEDEGPDWEFVRTWESPRPAVVVGRSSRVAQEVDVARCEAGGIEIVRRSSGGAAIVAGPGCLMYAVVLSYQLRPELKDIRRAHEEVLGRLARSLRSLLETAGEVVQAGTSDLAFIAAGANGAPRKFSGNSLRAKRSHLLYHGTLLYASDLGLMASCLKSPPRQPEYRSGRPHETFVANVPLTRHTLVEAVHRAWPTAGVVDDWPASRVARLVTEQFSRREWNFEFP